MIEVRGNATPHSVEQAEQIVEAHVERTSQTWATVLLIAGSFLRDGGGPLDVSFEQVRVYAFRLAIDGHESWDFQQVSRIRRAVIKTLEEIEDAIR